MTPQEIGTAELRRSADETAWRDFRLTNVAQERGALLSGNRTA
jgi:hypothetical protein